MAISLVQQVQGAGNATAVTSSAFASATTSGNIIIVSVACANIVPTVSDNKGNSYSVATSNIDWTGANIYIFYAKNITGGSGHTITVNSSSAQSVSVNADEVAGIATSLPLDIVKNTSGNSGTAESTGASSATNFANEYVYVAASRNAADTWTAGTGYSSLLQQNTQTALASESKIVSATGSQTGTFTATTGGVYAIVMATFSDTPVILVPTVTTQAVSSINKTTATGNGNITATGGANADERGIVYSTSTQAAPGNVAPASSGYSGLVNETGGSFGTGAFTESLTGLSKNTTYFARAYAHNSAGYSYGSEVSFTTLPGTPLIDAFSVAAGHDTAQFTDTTNGANTDPFPSGDNLQFVVPGGEILTAGTTYYWRVRAKDPSGTNAYGSWSTTRSFTTAGSAPASAGGGTMLMMGVG